MKTSRLTKSILAVVAIAALALPCVSFAQEVQIAPDNVAHGKPALDGHATPRV